MTKEISKDFKLAGLLKRIVGYEAERSSVSGPSGHPVTRTSTLTHLELLTDDGKIIPIDFNAYIGNELVNQRVSYISEGNVTTGDYSTKVGAGFARQDVIRQRLIPEDKNLPAYSTVNCVYEG